MPEVVEEIVIPDTIPEDITELAPLYKVLLHNDEETPAPFVIDILRTVFEVPNSMDIMTEAHNTGVALVQVVSFEQAEVRVERAHALARGQGFPLTFTIEPA